MNPARFHIGVIMDGNRRYIKHLLGDKCDTLKGHKLGGDKLLNILDTLDFTSIKELSMYLLSEDNLKRSNMAAFHNLFATYVPRIVEIAKRRELQVRFIKTYDGEHGLESLFDAAERDTRMESPCAVVNMCYTYSSKHEIDNACASGVGNIRDGLLIKNDVDIIIRTGGECRMSDFLLVQSAYANIFAIDKLFPMLTNNDIYDCIEKHTTYRNLKGQ